ncbi:MAG: hypothetical protein KGY99_06565 [Phycisphaerae bacterium]|nr:hypothetical protein [Phycisphaerae bacterium]
MRHLLTTVVVLTALAAGCERPHLWTGHRRLSPAERNFQGFWQASHEVLRDYRFDIDWSDRRSGTIQTDPMTGMHVTEFWRTDSTTPAQIAESSLQTIYRTATVEIRGTDEDGGTFDVAVHVDVARSNRPALQVTSTSQARSLYTGHARRELDVRRERVDGARPDGPDSHLVELGRDSNLEQRLAADIRARAAELLAAETH